MSLIRDMHERYNRKFDTHSSIQFQLTIELCDCPTSRSSARTRHVFVTLVCADKLRVSHIRDNCPQGVKYDSCKYKTGHLSHHSMYVRTHLIDSVLLLCNMECGVIGGLITSASS